MPVLLNPLLVSPTPFAALVLFRLLLHNKNAKMLMITTAHPPTTPPTIGAMLLDFDFVDGGELVCTGVVEEDVEVVVVEGAGGWVGNAVAKAPTPVKTAVVCG